MKLTPYQNKIIKYFWKVGRFRAEDLAIIYTTTSSQIECIKRLLTLGIIELETGNYFKINRERYLEFNEE